MVNDKRFDQMYDDDDLDPEEESPIHAADTFPWWGKALAWMTWRCPMYVYCGLSLWALVPLILGFWWVAGAMALVSFMVMSFCLYARKAQPDPFRYMILLSQAPIPPEDLAAAASGMPPPQGPVDRAQETQT